MVTLHIEGAQKLFLVLTNDGMIKRMGTGSDDCAENELFIGKSGSDAFERVRSLSGAVLENWLGTYADPNQIGKTCGLVIGFQCGKRELISEWEYGTESLGPPPEVSSLVTTAVESTNQWYAEQKKLASNARTQRTKKRGRKKKNEKKKGRGFF